MRPFNKFRASLRFGSFLMLTGPVCILELIKHCLHYCAVSLRSAFS
uniref:Uncharacterized protein n=1 Tax=Setaria italica TaxID=4555 RepID=K3YF16_SETIT